MMYVSPFEIPCGCRTVASKREEADRVETNASK